VRASAPAPPVAIAVPPPEVIAPCSIDEKSVDEPVPVVDGVAVVGVAVGEIGCGARSWLSSDTRMTTDCRLTN